MMKIGLCDDDRSWCDLAGKVIRTFAAEKKIDVEIWAFTDKEDLMLYSGTPLDILFLDIELGEDNGISIAGEINRKWTNCQIVFLTNYIYYALDIFQTNHVYYALKEQFEQRISEIFHKIFHTMEQSHAKILFTGSRSTEIMICPSEIYYLERNLRQTIIHTKNGDYYVKEKLDEILEKVLEYDFSRCHNSYVVYFPSVREKKKNSYVLENGKEILISRGYAKQSNEDWMRWALLQMS